MPRDWIGLTARLSVAGLSAVAIASTSAAEPAAADSWAPGPNSSQVHPYGVSAERPDGTVLVAGGDQNTPAKGELLSADGSSFSTVGAMKQKRIFGAVSVLANGSVLIAGGNETSGQSTPVPATAELWTDSGGGTFTPTGAMNVPRQAFTLTTLPNGEALAVGGSPDFGNVEGSATAELYNPSGNAWTLTGSMAAGRLGHTATLLPDCRVLVVGDNPTAELYNYVRGTFSAGGGEGAFQRSYQTATLMANGEVLIAGGEDPSQGALSSASIYNPATGTFTATPPMSTPHVQGFAALLPDGRVLVGGGYSDTGATTTLNVDIYDPGTNTWAPGPPLPGGDIAISTDAERLQNGEVVVTEVGPGGRNTAVFTPTAAGTMASPPPLNCSALTQGGGGGSGGSGGVPAGAGGPAAGSAGSGGPASASGSGPTRSSFIIRAVNATAAEKVRLTIATTASGTLSAIATAPAPKAKKRSRKHPAPVLFGRAAATVAHAGTVTLTISPSAAALRLLTPGKRLRVTITVRYSPTAGSGSTKQTAVTVRGQRRRKSRRP